MSSNLSVAVMGGILLVVVLGIGLVNARLQTAESQADSLNAAASDKIALLDAKNASINQQVASLQNNFRKLQTHVESGERDMKNQLMQAMAVAVEEAVAAAIEEMVNSTSNHIAVNGSLVVSGEQEIPSPEQISRYEDILMWLKDPENIGTVTFRQLEARALSLPLGLQEQVLQDIKTMVDNGEIDVETFF